MCNREGSNKGGRREGGCIGGEDAATTVEGPNEGGGPTKWERQRGEVQPVVQQRCGREGRSNTTEEGSTVERRVSPQLAGQRVHQRRRVRQTVRSPTKGDGPPACDLLERIAQTWDPEAWVWKGSGIPLAEQGIWFFGISCSPTMPRRDPALGRECSLLSPGNVSIVRVCVKASPSAGDAFTQTRTILTLLAEGGGHPIVVVGSLRPRVPPGQPLGREEGEEGSEEEEGRRWEGWTGNGGREGERRGGS